MTKFEEELFNKVPCKFGLTTEAEYKKSTLINHFKNWHSDEEFQVEIKKLTDQLITRNDELISSNYEIESLKYQLISREKQVMELKEADKAQGKEIVKLKSQLQQKDEYILKVENENSFLRDKHTTFDSNGMAVEPKLQQQALPVVPECVGEWIECVKGKNKNALALLDDDNMPDDVNEWLFFQRNDDNINLILRAWLDGYKVEKPQQKRYEVKLLSGETMYFNPIGNPKNIKDYRFSFGNYAGWKTQFTKSELAEIKDGMFLKRIPGGTPLDDLGKDKSYYVWIEDCNYWKNPFIELVPVEDGE
ncbi:DUF1642 domain-containing protein [Lactococcus lactis]|uniref:DUF1642 domain-containing protein n=1 Tax=Lactococcus lactis TaxID=1358 RepID=UPI0032E36F95